jgi:hypothetical protein
LIWLLIILLLPAACSRNSEGDRETASDVGVIPLDVQAISSVMEVTAIQPVEVPGLKTAWLARVDDVLWSTDSISLSDGGTLAFVERSPGDAVVVVAGPVVKLESGMQVLIVATQLVDWYGEYTVDPILATFRSDDLTPLEESIPSDLRVLAANPEAASLEDLKAALAAFADEVHAYVEADVQGDSSPPVGEHLARARAARGYAPGPTGPSSDYVNAIGMTRDAYLALDSSQRQLLTVDEVGVEIAAALNLVDQRIMVVGADSLVDSYSAIGFRTTVGVIGPYLLSENRPLIEMITAVQRGATPALAVWDLGSNGLVADARPYGGAPTDLASIGLDGSGVLVVDIREGTALVATEREAAALVDQFYAPTDVAGSDG